MADEKPYFEGEFYKPTFIFCCIGAGIVLILLILYAILSPAAVPEKPEGGEAAVTESGEPAPADVKEKEAEASQGGKASIYITLVLAFLGFALAALERAFLLPSMKKWYYGMRLPFATEKFSVHAPEIQMKKIGLFPENIKELHRPGRGQVLFTPKGYWELHPEDDEIGFESTGRLVYAQRKDKAATTFEARLTIPYFPFLFIASIVLAAAASGAIWAIIIAIIGLVAFLILFYLRQSRQMAILKSYINAVGEEALKEYEKIVAGKKAGAGAAQPE